MKNTVIRALFTLVLLQIAAVFAYANGPGSLDLTFAGTGYIRDAVSPSEWGRKVVIQPDGKILVLSYDNLVSGISRFNPDGTLDTSFGNGGRVLPHEFFGFPRSSGSVLLLQPDGKIVFTGALSGASNGGGTVIRFNSNGTPDPTFDHDGKVMVDYANAGGSAQRAALGPDGKIAIQGFWVDPRFSALYAGMAVYNSDGSYDTSFGVNGRLASVGLWSAISFQADGKTIGVVPGLRAIRRNANGSADTSFDGDGTSAAPDLPQDADTTSVVLLPDGRILVGGSATIGPDKNFCIVRYNIDGSLDTTFNGTGTVKTPMSTDNADLEALAVQSDGKIVAGGSISVSNSVGDISLVRYNFDGSLDTTYGSNGKAVIDLGFGDKLIGMALDSVNRAVITGQSQTAYVARITSEAAPLVDVGGRATTPNGQGISNAIVFLINENNERRNAITNGFGYYIFSGVSSNETYTVFVSAKRYRFQPPTRSVTLMSSVMDLDFIGNPGSQSLVDRVIGDEKSATKNSGSMEVRRPLNGGKIPR
jgi:uncharacterized delta-60 repeat protein